MLTSAAKDFDPKIKSREFIQKFVEAIKLHNLQVAALKNIANTKWFKKIQ